MGEVDISCSPSAKATVRLGSAITTRCSPSVWIDDATLDTVFCPVDGLSIASTLDDVFCSAPADNSIVESPTQRRRKQLGEVRSPRQRDPQSPLKKDNNRLLSPRTPSGRSSKDLSKHRKAEIKSSPWHPSASKQRNIEQESLKSPHAQDDMIRKNSPLRSASKSRLQSLETAAEMRGTTLKRRSSVSQRKGAREMRNDVLANNSKRTRRSSQKLAIMNLEKRIERSASSHGRGSSEPRIRALRQQEKDDVVEGGDRSSRTRSLERKVDQLQSTQKGGNNVVSDDKLGKEKRKDMSIAPKRSKVVPGRSRSASGLERLAGQTRRALNKRSSSDSRIAQTDRDHESRTSSENVQKKVSPQRNRSKGRTESLQSPSGRSRRSPKRRNSSPRVENTAGKFVKGITDSSQRAARSLQRNNLKAKGNNEVTRSEFSRSSHRRRTSKSPIKDFSLQQRIDVREKSQRTRGSHPTNSFRGYIEESVKGKSERRSISQDKREKWKHRGSKSRIVLPYDTDKGDSSKSSNEPGNLISTDLQLKKQGRKMQDLGSWTDTMVGSESSPHTHSSDVNDASPKSGTVNNFQTDKGYLIRPFWRKNHQSTDKKSPAARRGTNRELVSSQNLQYPSQNFEHEPENNNRQHGTKSTKKKTSFPMLYSNFQPLSGELVGDAKLSQHELFMTREHFPTALEALEASITPKKEERLALLQTAETNNEQHTPASPRGRIKSLSPTRFIKKASKRFSSAVAQFSERVLPVGTRESSSRKGEYAQNNITLLREEAPREPAVQSQEKTLASSMQSNIIDDGSKEDSITLKEVKGSPSPKQSTLSRARPRSRSAGRLQPENDKATASTQRTNNGSNQHPH